MSDFNPGDLVLFNYDTAVGYIRESGVNGCTIDYSLGPDMIGTWFALADSVSRLPSGLAAYPHGATVRVAAVDAPTHTGRTGVVIAPELQGPDFGYWLHIDGEQQWVPAVALSPVEAGERR